MGMFFNDIGPLGWAVIFIGAYWKHILLAGGVVAGLIVLGMHLAG